MLLTPRDILTKDETWINRADLLDRFELISASLPNATLRAQVNDYLRRVLPRGPKVTKAETRDAIAGAAEKFPEVLDYYVREKEDNGHRAKQVSEQRVANVEKQFVEQVRLLVASYLEPAGFYRFSGNTYEEAMERVRFLKDAIENKGAHRILYVNGEPIQREADLQILYRLTWFATPSDVSREVNDGRGPADFKISRGSADKTIVEFKLGKNTQLERNLQKQAEIYERASDATQPSIKVILYFDLRQKRRVERILKRLDLLESPHIVLVDACFGNKLSASKA